METRKTSDERAKIARKMFLSEAHMVGMLQHPHILPIYDAGEENGRCYIVTEHVHGARTLSAYCRPDNLLRIDDVVEIMFKCAKALHYAHTRGVDPSRHQAVEHHAHAGFRRAHHRLRHRAGRGSEISRIEGIAGSPSYMSPEQVQSLELTHHSDLYSLGAVMYELLTGIRPFRAGNLVKLLHQIVYATPPPIHTQRKDVPEELEEIVVRRRCSRRRTSARNRAPTSPPSSRACTSDCASRMRASTSRRSSTCLRRLRFFHEFSHAEIWEVLRASDDDGLPGGRGDRQGRRDGRSLLHPRQRQVQRGAPRQDARFDGLGDCFGETSYVRGARRTATIRAESPVRVLRVSSTLLEQVSPPASCASTACSCAR